MHPPLMHPRRRPALGAAAASSYAPRTCVTRHGSRRIQRTASVAAPGHDADPPFGTGRPPVRDGLVGRLRKPIVAGLTAPAPTTLHSSRRVGDSMNTTCSAVTPMSCCQVARSSSTACADRSAPARIPFAEAEEDALPVLKRQRRRPAPVVHREEHTAPSAARRWTCEAMGTVRPPANSSSARNREYCEGIPVSGRARTDPACQNTPASAADSLQVPDGLPSRISTAWSAPRAGAAPSPRRRPHPEQGPLQVRRQRARHGQRHHSGAASADHHAADQPTCVWQSRGMPTLSEDLTFRGLIHQMTDPDLPKRLDQPGLTVYAGFDPSADSLHVGNLLQLCTLRRFQDGRSPAHLPGRRRHRHDRRPGRQAGERQLLDPRDHRGLPRRDPPPTRPVPRSRPRPLPAAQQRRLAGPTLHPRVPARCGQALHGQPDGGQGVGQEPLRAARPGHLLHRVQLHAAAGLRLPAPAPRPRLRRCSSAAATSGATSPWASTTSARSAATRSGASPRRWSLKADGTKYGKTESGTVWLDPKRTSPFAMYQFFLNTPDEQVGRAPAVPHLPRTRRHHRAGPADGRTARSGGRPSGPWPGPSPGWCTARPRWPSARRPRPRSSARRSPRSARRCCWPSPRTPRPRMPPGRAARVA